MKRIIPVLFSGVCLLVTAVTFTSCKLVAIDEDTPPLEQLEVSASEVSNWKPEASMGVYIGDKLYDLIDGGAPQYLDKGCKKTGFQRLNGQSGTMIAITVMDFGKDVNATAMFAEMQMNNAGQSVADPEFPATITTIVPVMGGVTGYAHFANYYFELSVTGFSDQTLAIQTFDMFIGLFQKKLNL